MATTITNVKIRKIVNDDKLKAIISITLNDDIAIHDVKVVQGTDRLFVAMPSKKDETTGVFKDLIHPINTELRDEMEKKILDEYTRYIEIASINI